MAGIIADFTGISVSSLSEIDPFRDNVSTAGFVILMGFVLMVLTLMAFAFLYSACNCCASCFTCLCCSKSDSSKKE